MIKSFDCGNIDETKRKVFTENFVPQTPKNWMLDEVSWVYIKPYLIKYLIKKTASLYLYSFKRYQNFLLKIEILGFNLKSLQNRARMLKNHKIKYLGVLSGVPSDTRAKKKSVIDFFFIFIKVQVEKSLSLPGKK